MKQLQIGRGGGAHINLKKKKKYFFFYFFFLGGGGAYLCKSLGAPPIPTALFFHANQTSMCLDPHLN